MAAEDWAIVVGVHVYPGLGDLRGPRNDAQLFAQWLASPTGGAVPSEQLKLILSPEYEQPPQSATEAQPTLQAISDALDTLDDRAQKSSQEGQGLRVGRRLYLYMAGHGFAPKLEEAALLMANATRRRVGYHFPGKLWADWFYRAGYFDEILLFMDCCREHYPTAPLQFVPYGDVTGEGSIDRGKRFYGFATKWSRLARERAMEDGQVRGVFTVALLAGLTGGASQPDGRVTASSLSSFLYNNTRHYLREEDLTEADKATGQEPVCDFDTATGDSFVITTVSPARHPVTFRLPAQAVGKPIQVLGEKFAVVEAIDSAPSEWAVQLLRGLYLVQANGIQKPFEVTGIGPLEVDISA